MMERSAAAGLFFTWEKLNKSGAVGLALSGRIGKHPKNSGKREEEEEEEEEGAQLFIISGFSFKSWRNSARVWLPK